MAMARRDGNTKGGGLSRVYGRRTFTPGARLKGPVRVRVR